jgi:hypothetical protein
MVLGVEEDWKTVCEENRVSGLMIGSGHPTFCGITVVNWNY